MGLFGFLPTVNRCCFCTRKLKVASVLIAIWCMFAGSHSVAMIFAPACEKMFDKNREMGDVLHIYSLVTFVISVIFITSTFAFMLGIFLDIPFRLVTTDVFIINSFIWAIVLFVLGILQSLQYRSRNCYNPSDIVVCFIYGPCMIYFILIVSSFQQTRYLE